jgi:uncharacterized protein (DUF433 family)
VIEESTEAAMSNRLEVNPGVHFGKPCVSGTRIPVQDVLELVREGIPFERIVHDYYPDLTTQDIQACIQYAMDVVAVEDVHIDLVPA